jgi:UDP-N-acetylmuramate--alanine ligase
MKIDTLNRVYFLGVGGIGMSALARYFKAKGAEVFGYDKTPSPLTDALIAEGIKVMFDQDASSVPEADLYVFTPAIPKTHPAFNYVVKSGGVWFKRSEVLQEITEQTLTVAVAGTHGKTTTTAMLAYLLHQTRGDVAAFVGGVMTNYQSNLISCENPTLTVVEADEYDRSFLRLAPEIAVITSLDPDHLDIYGTFESMKDDYRTFASRAKTLIVHESVSSEFDHPVKLVYGFGDSCDFKISNIHVVDGKFVFQLNEIEGLQSQLAGKHNVENASAAMAVCLTLGVDAASVLASFKGVKRRFERVLELPNKVVIDDYAHHPKEIEAAINAAKTLYKGKKVAVVFQPHLFSRTQDLEEGFIESLSLADEVVLLPIYPAREEPIPGVTSANLLNRLQLKTKHLVEKSQLLNTVLSLTADVVLMLGAGDIDRLVQPLVNELSQTKNVE